MDWSQTLDNYCERLSPAFWAEPVNAVTNASFIIAAVVALVLARRRGGLEPGLAALILLVCLIGIGSFLFHTVATRWAVLADTVPIQIFILTYFALAMRRFVGLPWWGAGLATLAFVVYSALGGMALSGFVDLNGSEGYVPPLSALLVVGAALWAAGRPGPGAALIVGALIFAVSLAFRTADMAVCSAFPLGTHFMWHTLNGVLLGYLVIAMMRFGAPQRTA